MLTPDSRGYRTGSVLAGGTINVTGNIVAEAGARLDVSGAADTLDLLPAFGAGGAGDALDSAVSRSAFVPTRVESNGGTLTLAGAQELFIDATLRGAAGGPTAVGGSLVVTSGRFFVTGTTPTPLDVTLVVAQSGPVRPAGAAAVGVIVTDANGDALPQVGHFAADSLGGSGFDSLTLKGTVQFSGPVSLMVPGSLRVADGGVLFADTAVSLNAPFVALGTAFRAPLTLAEQLQPNAFTVGGQAFFAEEGEGAAELVERFQRANGGDFS